VGNQEIYPPGSPANVLKTVNGGLSWTKSSSRVAATLFGISCPTTTICYVVGEGGAIAKTIDGTHWTTMYAGSSNNLFGISCPSATVCVATQYQRPLVVTTDGGTNWVPHGDPSGFLAGISCPTTSVCFAGGSKLAASIDGGVTWSDQTPAGFTEGFQSVSCADTTNCVAVSQGKIYRTVDGTAWNPQSSTGCLLTGSPFRRPRSVWRSASKVL
jgi:photosystem II stability/assembly factor-like uncharacterized protein